MAGEKHRQCVTLGSLEKIVGLITPDKPSYFERQELLNKGYKFIRHENPCVILFPKNIQQKIH